MNHQIHHLSADDFEKIIKDKKVWLLDVREKYEFDAGYIKEAKLVPATRFEEEFEKLGIKKNEKIALYCRSGNRSAFIAESLAAKGYKNIFNLEEGIISWTKEKKAIVIPKN